jgi:hypothetical protein
MTASAVATVRAGGTATAAGRRVDQASWLVATGSLIFLATSLAGRPLYVDSYFALYAGRYVAGHGIPHHNVVTVIAHNAPWIDQQWLAQLAFYRVWEFGGYPAIAVMSAGLVAAGFVTLGALMLRRGVPPARMFCWTLAAFAVSYLYALPRTQSFGYLFLPLVLWIVAVDNRGGRPRPAAWLALPLLVVWANLHGSVLLGAGVVMLHCAARARVAFGRRDSAGLMWYMTFGVAAAAAVICTPYGLATLGYYHSLVGNSELARNVTEWAPPSPTEPITWPFFAVMVAVVVAVIVAWRRGARPDPKLAVIAAATLAMALAAFRNMPWFGFTGSLLAADTVARCRAAVNLSASFRRAVAGVCAGGALASIIILTATPRSQYEASVPAQAAAAAATIAASHPAARVLSDQYSAVGLLWLHPALLGRVGFDVRVEQYSDAQASEIFDFMFVRGPAWQRILHGYTIVVVSRLVHPALARAMARQPGWQVVYSDPAGVVLERASSGFGR